MWVNSSHGSVPEEAVWAGKDFDKSDIYVGRAFHEGDLLPAKVVPSKGGAFVSYDGKETSKFTYEVLSRSNTAWEKASNGEVPDGAIEVGRTKGGETLYTGRVLHDGTVTPGKVHPSHKRCYISYGGKELSFDTYEVLIAK